MAEGPGEALKPTSNKKPQYLVTLAVTLEVFAGGALIGWSAPVLPQLQADDSPIRVDEEQGSWIGSLLAIGALVGALPTGAIADIIGRKLTIYLMVVPQIASWIMIYFADSVGILYAARFIGGFGLGGVSTVVPMYVGEIAEDSIRGTLGSAFQQMLVTGVLYSYVVGALVRYSLLPLICGVLHLVFIAAFLRAPESPIYLLKKGKRKEAEESLRTLRGREYNIYRELDVMEKSLSDQAANKTSFLKSLTKRACVLGLIITFGIMSLQQLSGINIVIFYTSSIFKDAGSTLDSNICTIIVGFVLVVSTLLSLFLIDRAGRKILLQFSSSVMTVCLVVLGYYFHLKISGSDVSAYGMVPLASVVAYISVFAVGLGPIPWLLSGEMLTPEVKGTATGIAAALNWCFAFAVTKIFQPLSAAFGLAVTYWILAVICAVLFLFVTFVVVETKGKTLQQVQDELGGKKK